MPCIVPGVLPQPSERASAIATSLDEPSQPFTSGGKAYHLWRTTVHANRNILPNQTQSGHHILDLGLVLFVTLLISKHGLCAILSS